MLVAFLIGLVLGLAASPLYGNSFVPLVPKVVAISVITVGLTLAGRSWAVTAGGFLVGVGLGGLALLLATIGLEAGAGYTVIAFLMLACGMALALVAARPWARG